MSKDKKKNLKTKSKLIQDVLDFLNDCEIDGSEAVKMANCLVYLKGLQTNIKNVIKETK